MFGKYRYDFLNRDIPYVAVVFRDGSYFVNHIYDQNREYISKSLSDVLNDLFSKVKSGKILLKSLGEVSLDSKIPLTIDTNRMLIIEGDGNTIIIPPSNNYAFEFNADSDWSKRLVFKNLRFKASSNQYAIHLIDCHRPTFELCYFDRCNILVESINTFCEGYTEIQCYHNHCGVEFRKTGGTGSWSDAVMLHSHFDNIANGEYGIRINGGTFYRSDLYIVSVLIGGKLFDIASGVFGRNRIFAVLDGTSGTCFDITTTEDCYGNDIKVTSPPSGLTMLNNPNNKLFGVLRLIGSDDVWRCYDSIPIGVNNVYGSEISFKPYMYNKLPDIRIVVGGTFGTGETVTVKINVKYAHTTKYKEFSFTATADYTLSLADLFDLMVIYDGVNPLMITAQAKSSSASTSVTVTVHVIKR